MLNDLVAFASRFAIALGDAYVLPALFERVGASLGMAPRALVAEATFSNHALGEYLAKCAAEVAAADREGRPAVKVAA